MTGGYKTVLSVVMVTVVVIVIVRVRVVVVGIEPACGDVWVQVWW